MSKTRLLHERVADANEALRRFQGGSNSKDEPLVLVPDDRSICSCFLSVPTGLLAILHTWGSDFNEDALAPAGLQCLPPWHRIAYCVNQQAITYNAPVKSCPSSDNVMVDCDLTLVFNVGPAPQDVKKFVYLLGASRMNDFLAAATEEGIRQLVRQTPHTQIYELRGGAMVRDMLGELNEKFEKFGVRFTKAAITEVTLGKTLAHTLQATTEFDSKINEQEKHHDHNMIQIRHEHDKEVSNLAKQQERTIQDLTAAKERALVKRESSIIQAETSRDVAITKAEQNASVAQRRAEAELQRVENEAKKKATDVEARAKAEAEAILVKAQREAEVQKFEAQKKFEASNDLAQALRISAEAEGKAAESLKANRAHTLTMARQEVLEEMSRNGRIVVSGDNGDKIIRELLALAPASASSSFAGGR
eukprot:GABV01000395.1.p1 GENE.GABV01000395.1~~GABV01000395.1.p1  ORF type:complete len:420 (-),score=173.20 GABV01000395.1:58-1317(-)